MSAFARNLRFLRKQRGLNQARISALFGKRGNTVGNWENSKSEPSIGELVKLADYFKISLHDLLHTDLQEEAVNVREAGTIGSSADSLPKNAYSTNDSYTSLVQDSGNDSFWLILRELRTMNEKLDALKLLFESGLQRPGSDKSDH